MNDTRARLHVKVGPAEIEAEGSEDFIRDVIIPSVVDPTRDLVRDRAELVREVEPRLLTTEEGHGRGSAGDTTSDLAMGTIASVLDVKSGSDLVVAAAAYLQVVSGKPNFTRKELTEAMKTGDGFFRQTYLSNLSKSLQALVRNQTLLSVSGGKYSLSNTKKTEIERALAQHR